MSENTKKFEKKNTAPKKNAAPNKAGVEKKQNQDKKQAQGKKKHACEYVGKCGACSMIDMDYAKQLEKKKKMVAELLKPYVKVSGITGMEKPFHYRNKVAAVFGRDRRNNPISGVYEAKSHHLVAIEACLLENEKADAIIGTIRGLLKSFKIKVFDEDTGYGLLRYVLVRTGAKTGEIMVVLVTASPVFPSKQNFCKALRDAHPEITTIIQNVNDRTDSLMISDRENVFYGKGYIEDELCGKKFKISARSFYQVNPIQTEVLYSKAVEYAGLTGKETVLDAYCGIGTIGLIASDKAKSVLGVEVNKEAVKDAIQNAKLNGVKNARFIAEDAGAFMEKMAAAGEKVDVVFMDPPRNGSSEEFIRSVAILNPKRVVYVSCGPESLARDLGLFQKLGFKAEKAECVDMFPHTNHIETVCLLRGRS